MKQEIKNSIEEYVIQELNKLKDLEKTEEGYNEHANNSVNRIDTLIDLLQKEETMINDLHLENRKIDGTEIKNNSDTEFKRDELNIKSKIDVELRYDRIIKVVTDTAIVVVPIIFYNVWMKKGFIFEETGTFTSNTFKNLFSKFKPMK